MFVVAAIGVTVGVFTALSILLILAERLLVNYGVCNISVNDGECVFEVRGGSTLLSCLYDNNVFIPSACGGKGSCGFCKVTVLSGGGPLLPTETPYLTRSEQKAGVRLACQVKVKEDIEIRVPADILNVRLYRARVDESPMLTHDIREVNMSLIEPGSISQRPGQYVQILAPGPDGDVFRAYSISSPVYQADRVQLMVRIVPGGVASTYLHNVKPGEEVTFTGPFGEFQLSADPETEIVCVGGGCGMAPMKNIIYSLYDTWPNRSCWLFFGCRGKGDVFYRDEFLALAAKHPNLKVIYALSDPLDPGEEWGGETGFIHLAVDKHLEQIRKRQAFLCGPPPMIDAVTEVLQSKGMKDEQVFYDKF